MEDSLEKWFAKTADLLELQSKLNSATNLISGLRSENAVLSERLRQLEEAYEELLHSRWVDWRSKV